MNYQQQDLRHSKRFQMKSTLLHILFPVRIIACITLAVLSYCHWIDIAENAEKDSDETNIRGKLLYITLFAIVIFLASIIGWSGVIRRNWSLVVAFNGTAMLIIMIDIYMTIFDIRFYLISLIITIIMLIVNIFLAIDLDERLARISKRMQSSNSTEQVAIAIEKVVQNKDQA
uniref:Uncharacterized protein LOC113794795 n=1 Tax=Dermatophagoides pteronyssinus TaxID=6956 RepID=A0A6P6Y868_DERPT|nr:uncharacterized protein LOC113794795 [Dermatophagoides pteronyssinus]